MSESSFPTYRVYRMPRMSRAVTISFVLRAMVEAWTYPNRLLVTLPARSPINHGRKATAKKRNKAWAKGV